MKPSQIAAVLTALTLTAFGTTVEARGGMGGHGSGAGPQRSGQTDAASVRTETQTRTMTQDRIRQQDPSQQPVQEQSTVRTQTQDRIRTQQSAPASR